MIFTISQKRLRFWLREGRKKGRRAHASCGEKPVDLISDLVWFDLGSFIDFDVLSSFDFLFDPIFDLIRSGLIFIRPGLIRFDLTMFLLIFDPIWLWLTGFDLVWCDLTRSDAVFDPVWSWSNLIFLFGSCLVWSNLDWSDLTCPIWFAVQHPLLLHVLRLLLVLFFFSLSFRFFSCFLVLFLACFPVGFCPCLLPERNRAMHDWFGGWLVGWCGFVSWWKRLWCRRRGWLWPVKCFNPNGWRS